MHRVRVLAYPESRKQKTGIERSRYPNRAVTLIEQSPQQNYFQSLPHLLKISGYATA